MGGHDDSHEDCHDQSADKGNTSTNLKYATALGLFSIIDGPVTFFREKVVVPLQAKNQDKYYHRRFRRVPTIDQCDYDDTVCAYEADEQFRRDKMVDTNIVKILRNRKLECYTWEGPGAEIKCRKMVQDYEEAATNWFIKYGEMQVHKAAQEAYMKQKHRLIWQRRNPDKKLM